MIDLPEATPATHVKAWATTVLRQARRAGQPVRGPFNGEPMLAYPDDTVETILTRHYRARLASEATPEQARDLLTRPSGRRITHLPFKTTHTIISPAKAGRIMNDIRDMWHVVQLLNFRVVIMWKAKGGNQ